MKAHDHPERRPLLLLLCILLSSALLGCRTTPVPPYAWMPTEEDPRLLMRVPVGTPGSTTVPMRERLHKTRWATEVGQVESPDLRWSCCPEEEEAEEWDRNEVSLFLGYTGVRGGDGGTIGFDYERRFSRLLGVGLFHLIDPLARQARRNAN